MKKSVLVMIAATLAAVLTSCSGASSATTAAAAGTTAAAGTAAASDSSKTSTYAGKTLIMATNAEFPPYEYHDGNDIVGIDVEIAKAIAEEMGAKLEVSDIAFDAIIPAIQSDKADFGAAGMTVTDDRKTQVDFSDTYATAVQSVIVKDDSAISTIDDLKGKIIGVQEGTTGDIYSSDDFGDSNVQRFPKGADAVQALVSGKVDAVIIDDNPAKVFVSENEGLKLLDSAYADEQYAIAVKKGNTELLEGINTAIKDLKDSGKLDEIVSKYITTD